jgi:hypothetical protein
MSAFPAGSLPKMTAESRDKDYAVNAQPHAVAQKALE